MTFCPFCGVRQDVNLRQVHFRDLGTDASLPCPHCTTPLDVIEFDTQGRTTEPKGPGAWDVLALVGGVLSVFLD